MTKAKSAKGRGWETEVPEVRLNAARRRAVLEAVDALPAKEADVIQDVEVILTIATASRGGPGISGRRRLLDRLVAAFDDVERALLDLDSDTWDELVEDTWNKVELPLAVIRHVNDYAQTLGKTAAVHRMWADANVRVSPVIPVAITELRQAARMQRERLSSVEPRGKREERERTTAILRLAELFQRSTVTADDYRGRLVDFVQAALSAVRLPVPTSEGKVWQMVPKHLRTKR